MTQPERQLSAEAGHAADRGASRRAPSAAPDKSPKQTPGWQQIYSAASGAQQAELLALAERQGLLYGHQLPQSTNGQSRDEVRRFLSRVFAGAAREIAPVRAAPLDCAAFDAPQRDAAAWPMLLEFADRHERLLEQSREVARRREAVPEAVATIVARIQVSGTRESAELAAPEPDFERDIRAVVEKQNQSQTQIDQSLADCARRTQSSQDHL